MVVKNLQQSKLHMTLELSVTLVNLLVDTGYKNLRSRHRIYRYLFGRSGNVGHKSSVVDASDLPLGVHRITDYRILNFYIYRHIILYFSHTAQLHCNLYNLYVYN